MHVSPNTVLQYGSHHGHGWLGWAGWMGLFQMVVFVLLLAAVVLLFVRFGLAPFLSQNGSSGSGTGDPAIVTLREQYASGEIDRDEYDRRREVLEADDTER